MSCDVCGSAPCKPTCPKAQRDELRNRLAAAYMPEVMTALRSIREVPPVAFSRDRLEHANRTIAEMQRIAGEMFDRLDDWCWHVPPCVAGEVCTNGAAVPPPHP